MYIISACLLGENCRYNGTGSLYPDLKKLLDEGKAISVCPEVLGGLKTPREPCEIQQVNGKQRVISNTGKDCTQAFERGARETLKRCCQHNVKKAILKSRSPSCGFGKIYDGRGTGHLISGNGLTADLLHKNGIQILSEENYSLK